MGGAEGVGGQRQTVNLFPLGILHGHDERLVGQYLCGATLLSVGDQCQMDGLARTVHAAVGHQLAHHLLFIFFCHAIEVNVVVGGEQGQGMVVGGKDVAFYVGIVEHHLAALVHGDGGGSKVDVIVIVIALFYHLQRGMLQRTTAQGIYGGYDTAVVGKRGDQHAHVAHEEQVAQRFHLGLRRSADFHDIDAYGKGRQV